MRQGAHWDRTLLLITFDEHGGLYDDVVPPHNATPPGGYPEDHGEFGFQFDRFGLRVPAVFVSPYVEAATVVRAPGETPFDHTTIIKTLCNRWNLEPLTERDRAAPDFMAVLTRPLDEPRMETPTLAPRPYVPAPEPKAHQSKLGHLGSQMAELVAAKLGEELPTLDTVGDMFRHFFHR
jgi:phospholipase C